MYLITGITSQTNKQMWARVETKFNQKATKNRTAEKLEKKWLNMVAKHRLIYTDYIRDRALTGTIPYHILYCIIQCL